MPQHKDYTQTGKQSRLLADSLIKFLTGESSRWRLVSPDQHPAGIAAGHSNS
jgi:hypothetical protein